MKYSFIKRQILSTLVAVLFAGTSEYLFAQKNYVDPQSGIHYINRIKPGNDGNGRIKPNEKHPVNLPPTLLKPLAGKSAFSPDLFNPNGADLDWQKDIGIKKPVPSWTPNDLAVDQSDNLYILNSEVLLPERKNFYLTQFNRQDNQIWQDKYNGPENADDEGRKLIIDSEGNIITIANADNDKLQITRKHSSTGTLLWEKQFRDSRSPSLWDSDQDRYDNIYQLIYLNGSAWNPGESVLQRDTLVVHKYSSSGDFTALIRDPMDEDGVESISQPCYIGTDSLRNVYVLVIRMNTWGNDELVLRKYTSDGRIIFIRKIAAVSNSYYHGFKVTEAGNIYISYNSTSYKYVSKYSTDGDLLWYDMVINYRGVPEKILLAPGERVLDVRSFSVTCFSNEGNMLWKKDFEENHKNSALDKDGNLLFLNISNSEIKILKISIDDGSVLWKTNYTETDKRREIHSAQLKTNSMGDIYILSYESCMRSGRCGLMLKYDANGELKFETRFDKKSTLLDRLEFMKINKQGDIYIFQYSNGFLWILKYTSDGTLQIKQSMEGLSFVYGCEPMLDSQGNIYLLVQDYPKRELIKINPNLNVLWRRMICDTDDIHTIYFDLNLHGESAVAYIYSEWNDNSQTSHLTLNKFDCNGNKTFQQLYDSQTPRLLNIQIDRYSNIYSADDFSIRKFLADGAVVWQKQIDEGIVKFIIDDWGYPTAITFGGNRDVNIIKISPLGNIDWKYNIALPADEDSYLFNWITSIQSDAYGRTLILLPIGTPPTGSMMDWRYLTKIIALTRQGNLQWKMENEEPSNFSPLSINADVQGNLYVTIGIYLFQPPSHINILKYNYDGKLSWSKSVATDGSFRYSSTETALSDNGEIFLATETSGYNWSLLKLIKISQTGEDALNQSITNLEIKQNFPNPFNNQTTILYRIPQSTHVTLKIYDLNGRKVFDDDLGQRAKGEYTYFVDSRYLASSTYYYQIQTDSEVKTGKMVLIK